MTAIRASFTLKTALTIKCVHILGSWDLYCGQLPLTKIKEVEGAASWSSTFDFQDSILQPGKRYWYYYLLNGYEVFYDSTSPVTIEPTTCQTLNIFDVPTNKPTFIADGRPLDISQIEAPKPVPSGLSRTPSVLFHEANDAVEAFSWHLSTEVLACNNTEVSSTSLAAELITYPRTPANSPVNANHNVF
ncbi:hypothetical protein ACMFMG_012016 [Clarireedia jacksonii]